jgi:hypothetical protein
MNQNEGQVEKIHKIAIIGSAGRKGDAKYVTADSFNWMINDVRKTLVEQKIIADINDNNWNHIHLISGGAAFADHVAVVLALETGCKLTLCMPCDWDFHKKQFKDIGIKDWKKNPGGTSNYYHNEFSKKTGRKSLEELNSVIPTANISTEKGFHQRNSLIAGENDLLITYTFNPINGLPSSSGTLDTWNKSVATLKISRAILH